MQIVLAVRLIFYTDDNKILLLRRSDSNKRESGRLELPGGKCDVYDPARGVSLEKELLREVHEETGIVLDRHDIAFQDVSVYKTNDAIFATFVYAHFGPNVPVSVSEEHDTFEWISMSSLQQTEVTSVTQQILNSTKFVHNNREQEDNTVVNKSTNMDELIIYTDGGSRGNPGPSASGYVIMNKDEELIEEGGEYLGITTNNQAEYQAVKLALEKAAKYHAKKIIFKIDSELVVRQMTGQYKIRNRELWPVHTQIKELLVPYKKVIFMHVRRELNKQADAKVNEILDSRKS